MNAILEASTLTVRRGHAIPLDGVGLDVRRGEVVGVLGPNGAGKSTLLAALAGSLRPTSGSVTIEGEPITRQPPERLARRRAVLFQELATELPYLVREVVAMGAELPHDDAPTTAERIREALDAVDLEDFGERTYTTLSGGEKRRVQLARVLAQLCLPSRAPGKLLFLDEPFAALDVREVDRLLRLLRTLRALGAALVVSLHDLTLAPVLCDRVVILQRGRLVAIDEPTRALASDTSVRIFGGKLEQAVGPSGTHWVVKHT